MLVINISFSFCDLFSTVQFAHRLQAGSVAEILDTELMTGSQKSSSATGLHASRQELNLMVISLTVVVHMQAR